MVKEIRLKESDNLRVITPFGELVIKLTDKTTDVWAYDEDKWEGIPKPEVINIRGEKVLFFCMSKHLRK